MSGLKYLLDSSQVAIAECMGAVILGHDRIFSRLDAGYEDFRR